MLWLAGCRSADRPMNLTFRMQFPTKALLCAITCLAAVLTAATLAQAVDQTPKNGCTSP